MGGLIALMVEIEFPSLVDALILEAPAIKIHPSTGAWWQILGAKLLNRIAPNTKVVKVDINLISRNPTVVQSIADDELTFDCGGCSDGFVVKMLNAQDYVISRLDTIKCKVLLASGTDDFLTCKTGADLAASKIDGVTYNVYEGGYHQLHADDEPTTNKFMADVADWIQKQF